MAKGSRLKRAHDRGRPSVFAMTVPVGSVVVSRKTRAKIIEDVIVEGMSTYVLRGRWRELWQ